MIGFPSLISSSIDCFSASVSQNFGISVELSGILFLEPIRVLATFWALSHLIITAHQILEGRTIEDFQFGSLLSNHIYFV